MKMLNRFLCRWPRFYFQLMGLRQGAADEKRLYLLLLRRGDVVFDVGANIGYFSDLFASIIGSQGRLFSFEPSPVTVKELERAVAGQTCPVRIVNAACGDTEGEVELFQKGEDSGQASLHQQSQASWESAEEVKAFPCHIIRLDQFIRTEKIHHLDFLKCDVEGAELLAFRGMGDELARLSPVILFELFPAFMKSFGYQPDDLFAYLRSQGYDTFYKVAAKLELFAADQISPNSSLNILAIRRDRHAKHLARLRSASILEDRA